MERSGKLRGGTPLLARWTSDFDCGYETNWWYVIKDNKFDISELKAKRRYEINKGKKNFEVRQIVPTNYIDDLLNVQIKAFSAYPEKYRPLVDPQQFRETVTKWNEKIVYGAFDQKDKTLCGYACLTDYGSYMEFSVLKVIPEYERLAVNAAIVAAIVEDSNVRLGTGFYINDGSRSIFHETFFQDYLEKYFGFRKAYCHLNIVYNPKIKWIIRLLYPWRRVLEKCRRFGAVGKITGVLRMEEYANLSK